MDQLQGESLRMALGIKRRTDEDDASFAHRLSAEIDEQFSLEAVCVYDIGRKLLLIQEEGLFQEGSFDDFVESTRIAGWGRSKTYEILGQVQDFILGGVRKVEIDRLSRIGWRKLQEVRGAVRAGIVDVDDALADAEALSARELKKRVRDWKKDHLRSLGMDPDCERTCEICMYRKSLDSVSLWVGEESGDDEHGRIVLGGEILRLKADRLVYCSATGNVLAVNKAGIGKEAQDRAEGCEHFTESP